MNATVDKAPDDAEDYFQPIQKPEPISLHAPNPVVKRLNKKMVVMVALVLGLCIAFALLSIFEKPKAAGDKAIAEKPRQTAPAPMDAVNAIPSTYAEVKTKAPRLGPPKPGEFGVAQVAYERRLQNNGGPYGPPAYANSTQPQLTPDEKEVEAQRIEQMKRAAQARQSSLLFGGGEVGRTPNNDNAGLAEMQKILQAGGLQNGTSAPTLKPVNLSRDDDNRQDDKSDFANKKRSTDPYLQQKVVKPTSPYFIGAGAIIPGVFLTGINSDLPGQITGQVSQDVFDTVTGRFLLLPQGSIVIGEYDSKVTYGQERVLIVWTRIRRPDGTSISLEGMPGVDLSGYAGVSDRVNNHWGKLVSGVIFGSVLGATAQVAQGANTANPAFGQLAVQGASQNLNQAGQALTRKNLNIQPTLEIRPGLRFNISVTKDVELPVYGG